jgi:hypothetical protein
MSAQNKPVKSSLTHVGSPTTRTHTQGAAARAHAYARTPEQELSKYFCSCESMSSCSVSYISVIQYSSIDYIENMVIIPSSVNTDTRTQATLFDVMPLDTREMLPSCDNI